MANPPSMHRSSSLPLMDDEMVALEQKEREESEKEREKEFRALNELANLNDHPGYQKMREARLETIKKYRSGEVLKDLLATDISNEKLGEMVRVTNLVADELEKELLTIEAAVKVVEEEKANKRERRKD